jgi:diketogulonate reductase-like aldo/keto reductase
MKYSSFVYLSCLLVAIFNPVQCLSEGFFGKLVRLATGGSDKTIIPSKHNKGHQRSRDRNSQPHEYPTTKLSNGVNFPLVGVGVGNMNPRVVPAIISHGLKDDRNIRLIDTAHVSQNEFLVAKGIVEGVDRLVGTTASDAATTHSGEKFEVHVTTKIWYTHLGYDRTLLAIKDSLHNFQEAIDHPNVDLKLHVLLHWPRCYEKIPWMDCSGEEANLPSEVKQAGPAPHLDPQNAWKGSWKALEEVLTDPTNAVASIGVSNFHRKELEELTSIAKILPHIVETDTWSLLYDPLLIEFCHKKGIHIIAYHLMQGVISKAREAPFATHHLLSVANDITKEMRSKGLLSEDSTDITAAQVVLAWLVQHSISVIPMTTDLYHLRENSATALTEIPPMDDSKVRVVAQSVEALISGEDLTEDAFVTLTFHAKSKDVFLYWHDPEFGGEIEVAKIQKGKSFEEASHPGHQFRIYYDDSENVEDEKMELFTVSGNYGEHRHIEL